MAMWEALGTQPRVVDSGMRHKKSRMTHKLPYFAVSPILCVTTPFEGVSARFFTIWFSPAVQYGRGFQLAVSLLEAVG